PAAAGGREASSFMAAEFPSKAPAGEAYAAQEDTIGLGDTVFRISSSGQDPPAPAGWATARKARRSPRVPAAPPAQSSAPGPATRSTLQDEALVAGKSRKPR